MKELGGDGYFYSQGLGTTTTFILFLKGEKNTFQALSAQSGVQEKSKDLVTRGIGMSFGGQGIKCGPTGRKEGAEECLILGALSKQKNYLNL